MYNEINLQVHSFRETADTVDRPQPAAWCALWFLQGVYSRGGHGTSKHPDPTIPIILFKMQENRDVPQNKSAREVKMNWSGLDSWESDCSKCIRHNSLQLQMEIFSSFIDFVSPSRWLWIRFLRCLCLGETWHSQFLMFVVVYPAVWMPHTHTHTHSMLLLGGVRWAHTVGCFFSVSSSREGLRWKKCALLGSVMPLGCYCSALISLAGLCSRLKAVMDFGREGSSRSNVFWHFFLRLWFIPSLNKS